MTLTNLLKPNRPKVALKKTADDGYVSKTDEHFWGANTVTDNYEELNAADPRFVGLISTAADEGAPDSSFVV